MPSPSRWRNRSSSVAGIDGSLGAMTGPWPTLTAAYFRSPTAKWALYLRALNAKHQGTVQLYELAEGSPQAGMRTWAWRLLEPMFLPMEGQVFATVTSTINIVGRTRMPPQNLDSSFGLDRR